jgi:hypothetical protein
MLPSSDRSMLMWRKTGCMPSLDFPWVRARLLGTWTELILDSTSGGQIAYHWGALYPGGFCSSTIEKGMPDPAVQTTCSTSSGSQPPPVHLNVCPTSFTKEFSLTTLVTRQYRLLGGTQSRPHRFRLVRARLEGAAGVRTVRFLAVHASLPELTRNAVHTAPGRTRTTGSSAAFGRRPGRRRSRISWTARGVTRRGTGTTCWPSSGRSVFISRWPWYTRLMRYIEQWQNGDISRATREPGGAAAAASYADALKSIRCKALIMPTRTDIYFPVRPHSLRPLRLRSDAALAAGGL